MANRPVRPWARAKRVHLSMDRAALTAARAAARARNMSLSEWVSRAAWDRAIWEAARSDAEQGRAHTDELVGGENDAADRIFGGDKA